MIRFGLVVFFVTDFLMLFDGLVPPVLTFRFRLSLTLELLLPLVPALGFPGLGPLDPGRGFTEPGLGLGLGPGLGLPPAPPGLGPELFPDLLLPPTVL